jgi:hypothetical protein
LLVLALGATAAQARGIGIGAFGGTSIPIANDLAKSGSVFGIRVPVSLLPLLTVEPYASFSSLGDAEETFSGVSYTRDGGKNNGFGANVLVTFGGPVKLFPIVGLGSYKIERDGSEDISDVGYNFGLGLGFAPIPNLELSVRGELNAVVTDATARKAANVTVGAHYNVFTLP